MQTYFCIDPGTEMSGVSLLSNGQIIYGANTINGDLLSDILKERERFPDLIVLIEDVAPYSMKMMQDVINTCKFIGEITYCLRMAKIDYACVLRWNVKKWVFDNFYDVVAPEIKNRIEKRKFINKDGEFRQPTFVFVNDRGVLNAMKKRWGIVKPKPGEKNKIGLTGHAWQALAVGTFFIDNYKDDLML